MTTENPYQAPLSAPAAANSPSHSLEKSRQARSIRAICILYVVFGSVAILAGIGLFFDTEGDIPWYVPYIVIPAGLMGVVSAIGVLRRRKWGVPFCMIV